MERLFIRACSDRTRGNGFKVQEGRFRLDIRKKFFYDNSGETQGEVFHRSCSCPITEVFKVTLDGALSNLF